LSNSLKCINEIELPIYDCQLIKWKESTYL
jgi:hypothetical protein